MIDDIGKPERETQQRVITLFVPAERTGKRPPLVQIIGAGIVTLSPSADRH